MTQYEIWWAEMPLPVGRRPLLLLSRPSAYLQLDHVIAAEITTTIRGIPVEVAVGKAEGLRQRSVVNLDKREEKALNFAEAVTFLRRG